MYDLRKKSDLQEEADMVSNRLKKIKPPLDD